MPRVESVRGAVVYPSSSEILAPASARGRRGLFCYFAFRSGPSVQVVLTKVLDVDRRAPVVFEIGSPTIELAVRRRLRTLYDAICGDTELKVKRVLHKSAGNSS